jgi:hypothetical protein
MFAYAGWFAEGLAAAGRTTAQGEIIVGFVDRSGEWVVEPRFAAATSFAGARAIGFCVIWAGLAVFVADGFLRSRRIA